ncbi:D-alanine--D-alanine ligase [Candidatus Uhrbacteria bacterium]|nr:D-alanine--D-alanine ligase [Candidatus Uhrbacteria bacterium]
MKKNVAILFGGQSAEHDVSLMSAQSVYDALDKEKYNPVLIGIDKSGRWLLGSDAEIVKVDPKGDEVVLVPGGGGKIYNMTNPDVDLVIDVVFPVLHGPFGEDGTIQGLLKLTGVPFVGAGVLGSAVGLDKDVMKRLLRDADIPIGKFVAVRSGDKIPSFQEIESQLGSPVFIKPANMGSSVGVSKARDAQEYEAAVKEAFRFDDKVLIEEMIEGRELECAVLGNENPVASVAGEVIMDDGFYTYDEKYSDVSEANLVIPAEISDEATKQIKEIALRTFKTLECRGMGRVDVFLKANGDIMVNEINTIPGFTKSSMYPKLWEVSGVSYEELVGKLIESAR